MSGIAVKDVKSPFKLDEEKTTFNLDEATAKFRARAMGDAEAHMKRAIERQAELRKKRLGTPAYSPIAFQYDEELRIPKPEPLVEEEEEKSEQTPIEAYKNTSGFGDF